MSINSATQNTSADTDNAGMPISITTDIADELLQQRIDAACDQACHAIAPAWPLDRAIAVNPHWGRIGRSVRQVAARMSVLSNINVFPSREYLAQAWDEGRISSIDLTCALSMVPAALTRALTEQQCIDALRTPVEISCLPLLIDVLDDDPLRHARLSWRQAITHQVSQTCASYFDERQADWQPEREQGLYGFWRDTLTHDHGIGLLMGVPDLGKRLSTLPATRQDAERWVLQRLGLPEAVWADYLESVLLTVNGWASWCAYLSWQAGQEGKKDSHLRDLLAIRLAWGAIVLECKNAASAQKAFTSLKQEWSQASDVLKRAEESLVVDEVWQVALEVGYQRQLAQQLCCAEADTTTAPVIKVQAAFCIDVRSEPMRRALEAVSPSIQTIGFAGFFGLPVAYTPFATEAPRPQLPGLLAPALEVSDQIIPASGDSSANSVQLNHAAGEARQRHHALSDQWGAARRWPNAAFSFVDVAGLGYLGKLMSWISPSRAARSNDDMAGLPSRYKQQCRPVLLGLDDQEKADLAAKVLHAMGLDQQLSPLVLLVGHGSQTTNNAHAAALDCGACCGQTGEVNARVLAKMLNEPAVREGLQRRGISIPERTVFIAALHNTTTDEIEGFDIDLLPHEARQEWNNLQEIFASAGDQVRRERAPSFGLNPPIDHQELLNKFIERANDGAQTRPEWGLANNASFIIAPRERTQGLNLEGRSFLHDYNAANDTDGSVLELLMTAPMLVTHWINWQYHASACDPQRMGSGNKLLHNVVGGHIGVFEGNGGDLRIGLSRQSLHDGKRWMHEPLRLTAVIDAPAQAIERVTQQHAVVRQLLENGWLHLWRYEGDRLVRYAEGQWQALTLE